MSEPTLWRQCDGTHAADFWCEELGCWLGPVADGAVLIETEGDMTEAAEKLAEAFLVMTRLIVTVEEARELLRAACGVQR